MSQSSDESGRGDGFAGMDEATSLAVILLPALSGGDPLVSAGVALGHLAIQRIGPMRRRRALQVVEGLLEAAGHSPDAVARRIEDPAFAHLVVEAMEIAWRSAFEGKVRALRKVVAAAWTDDSLIDELMVIEKTLDRIEAFHLRVMTEIEKSPECDLPTGAKVTDLEAALGGTPGVVVGMLTEMQGLGLVHGVAETNGGPPPSYRPTAYGRRLLLLLSEPELH